MAKSSAAEKTAEPCFDELTTWNGIADEYIWWRDNSQLLNKKDSLVVKIAFVQGLG